ncbi:MAG: tRNA (adenosine(37)-N6)-threonylcarbamoyltransferase complex dimerization subunit type 1 TsaB [Methylococcaceae bacterium]|nr:MAG: tRNA (adenosine(37)-N6)-threonylcarbamoyltransferase complex dimerization subunit type 1 TsaB [Methylococcaceae bacterium]
MKLIAVETATEACSAALWLDGILTERFELVKNKHSQLILPMLEDLLNTAGLNPKDLTGLAFGCGPGSFTGVRIASGVIQGLAFALDLAVVPVSTLQAIAQDYFDYHNDYATVFVALDARMSEIYWAVYQRNALGYAELLGHEAVTSAANIAVPTYSGTGIGLGSGWQAYANILQEHLGDQLLGYDHTALPRARAIARCGVMGFSQQLAVPVELALPVYLRDNVAKKEAERN